MAEAAGGEKTTEADVTSDCARDVRGSQRCFVNKACLGSCMESEVGIYSMFFYIKKSIFWYKKISFDIRKSIFRFSDTVKPLWKGQECLTKVAKFGPFPCTILYKSCLFYPSWQATSFERPPSWVAFIEGFHCISKNIFWYQNIDFFISKIDFLISEIDFLISENIFWYQKYFWYKKWKSFLISKSKSYFLISKNEFLISENTE